MNGVDSEVGFRVLFDCRLGLIYFKTKTGWSVSSFSRMTKNILLLPVLQFLTQTEPKYPWMPL